MARLFLIQLLNQRLFRRLEIGFGDKLISRCSARSNLGVRVAMRDKSRKFTLLILMFAAIAGIPALIPSIAEACDPYAVAVRGAGADPGEDPHLVVKPDASPGWVTESQGCSGGGSAIAEEEDINAEGMREGYDDGLGSRVSSAWRAILWMWLWQLNR